MIDKQFEKEEFKKSVKENVKFLYRKTLEEATQEQIFQAVSYTVKDVIIDNWLKSQKAYEKQDPKIVYYMSMEFLMGRALGNNLINLGAYGEVKEALEELGLDINCIEDQEPDPALGNGGLGRLAACFLDSLAPLNYCAYGCGIRYRYGMFKQEIRDGYQIEVPDNWLKNGYPFELRRPEYAKEVHFGGYVRVEWDPVKNENKFIHEGYQAVKAVPYDMPITGYNNDVVNTLRIWDAEPIVDFNLDSFDKGDYHNAVEQENLARTIVEVLYPNDNHMAGKELRLKQQYFFVSASLQAAIAKYKKTHDDITKLHEKVVFQMNDTHPTVAVAELMRILLDEEGLEWDEAWEVTTKTCAYTNHTILAEALEKWPVEFFKEAVPQLLPIMEVLDDKVRRKFDDPSVYIIDKNDLVHMAHIDIHYGFSVNGVASLHTDILKETELNNFYKLYPEKFNNKTNGITFRRWLLHSNPELTDFITSFIGDGFKKDAEELKKLNTPVITKNLKQLYRLLDIKAQKKAALADYLEKTQGITINPDSIFDIQIKRLHEYKRQQMNALYLIHKYLEIKKGKKPTTPITAIFGAKAAPAYIIAKDIIHMILCLQQIIEKDPEVKPYLNVVMVSNYNVTLAEKLIPACDISEQISLASKEASGTGNMKFMLNGAVTLGTDDGANVEIHELVGDDNIYIFGDSSETVIERYKNASYCSKDYYDADPAIKEAVDFIISKKMLAVGDKENLERLYKELLNKDWFMTFPDFKAYCEAKEKAFADYEDRTSWARKMLVNISQAGYFSSDRTIGEYDRDIWKLR